MGGTGHRKDAWGTAPDALELHVICSQASFCLGGLNLLWGRVCLCFLGLPQEAVSLIRRLSQPCLDHLALSPLQSITAEAPIMPLSHCHCPCLVAVPDSHILTSFHLLFQVPRHFLKNCSLLLSLVYFISILIKNPMEPAWVHLLGLLIGTRQNNGML